VIYVGNIYWPLDYSMLYFRLHRQLDNGKLFLNEKFAKYGKNGCGMCMTVSQNLLQMTQRIKNYHS